MADPRQITELPVATSAADADIALIRQGTFDKQVTMEKIRDPLLRAANNLSDIANAATARTNLGISKQEFIYIDTGSANTYAISGTGTASYADLVNVWIRISNDNTGASTLEIESLGAKSIFTPDGEELTAGALVAEGVYLFVYDSDGDGGSGAFILQASQAAGVLYDSSIAGNVQEALDHLQTLYTDTGAADAMVITPSPAITAYATGQVFRVLVDHDNTGACTLNVNALGAKNIKTIYGADPEAGTIPEGGVLTVIYDGTNFQVLDSQGQLDIWPSTSVTLVSGASPGTTWTTVTDTALPDGTVAVMLAYDIWIYSSSTETVANFRKTGTTAAIKVGDVLYNAGYHFYGYAMVGVNDAKQFDYCGDHANIRLTLTRVAYVSS